MSPFNEFGMTSPQHVRNVPQVEEFLAAGGVKAVFCGHKPCGDSPFVVRGAKAVLLFQLFEAFR